MRNATCLVLALVLLSACGTGTASAPTPLPTYTPYPTYTPFPATNTPPATETLIATVMTQSDSSGGTNFTVADLQNLLLQPAEVSLEVGPIHSFTTTDEVLNFFPTGMRDTFKSNSPPQAMEYRFWSNKDRTIDIQTMVVLFKDAKSASQAFQLISNEISKDQDHFTAVDLSGLGEESSGLSDKRSDTKRYTYMWRTRNVLFLLAGTGTEIDEQYLRDVATKMQAHTK